MKRVVAVVVVWSIVAVPAKAEWARRYQASKGDRVEAVAALSNGGAVVATSAMRESRLFTTDAGGNVVASRQLELQPWFVVRGVGDAVFIGGSKLSINDGPELQVASFDATLAVKWSARFVPSPPLPFLPHAANATADGGLLIAGEVDKAAFVVRLAADGTVKWARSLNTSDRDVVRHVIATRDGGAVCAGLSRQSPWLAKLSANGDLEWQQTYPAAPGGFHSVIETKDGDLIAAGSSILLMRVTGKGERKWQKVITQPLHADCELVPVANDSFALAAQMEKKSLLVAFRGDGTMIWQQTFTPADPFTLAHGSPGGSDLAATSGGLLFAPTLTTEGFSRENSLLFRIDSDGKSGPWFQTADVPMQDVTLRAETLQIEIEPLRFTKQEWDPKLSDAKVTSSPFAVASAPAVPSSNATTATTVPPSRTSSYDRDAGLKEKARAWEELRRKKDFAQLEVIAAQLRAKPWSTDPLHWDIGHFYGALSSTAQIPHAEMVAILREWIQARPQSITPKIALAQGLYVEAVNYRGLEFARNVTESDWAMYEKLMGEAARTLASANGAESDAHYWTLQVRFANPSGGDPLAVARRAGKHTHNPDVFAHAVIYLLPQWQDRLDEFRPFAEEAAALTRSSMGDGMYTWLAYQAQFLLGVDKARTLGFDWPRVRQGARDLIRISPQWIPTYHRLALMARRADDRATAREMFQRPELDWYDAATSMWSRQQYDQARDWALRTPNVTPAAGTPAVASKAPSPAPVPAAQLKKAPDGVDLSSRPLAQWPQIVMQNSLAVEGVPSSPLASFLVKTTSGVVAVSVVPEVQLTTPGDSHIEYTRSRLTAWTMSSPLEPKRVLKVQTIETRKVPEYMRGVSLTLAPIKGTLPVHVLGMNPQEAVLGHRVFVVICQWNAGRCTQKVIRGSLAGSNGSTDRKYVTHSIQLDEPLDPATAAGAPVLDEDGYVFAVLTGHANMVTQAGALPDAEDLRSVVTVR